MSGLYDLQLSANSLGFCCGLVEIVSEILLFWISSCYCFVLFCGGNTYDQACSVKMVGYWPNFFTCFIWTETKPRSINSQEKEQVQYPAILTEQDWSIKDILYGFRGNFPCGIERVAPSGQDSSILSTRVANHNTGLGLSCPLTDC